MIKPHIQSILDAAQLRGIPVQLGTTREDLELGNGRYRQRFSQLASSQTSLLAAKIARSKDATNRVLRNAALPVPRSQIAHDPEKAAFIATQIGYPVVLKPVRGNQGKHVFVGIANEEHLRRLFTKVAQASHGPVQVEQQIVGNDYRILVLGGQTVAAIERVAASVIGDGHRSVHELIDEINADPRRGSTGGIALRKINIDDQTIETLADQRLTTQSVPGPNLVVKVKSVSNVSAGGTTTDRTDEVHPDNAKVAEMAALAIGLDVAGIDMILPHISRPVWSTGGAIIEVNSSPGFIDHLQPTNGMPRNIGADVINMLFPPGAPVKIPIIVVLHSPISTNLCQLLSRILQSMGKRTGFASAAGIEIDGMRLGNERDFNVILENAFSEIAIVELTADQILAGDCLPDYCSIVVVGPHAEVCSADSISIEQHVLHEVKPELATVAVSEAIMFLQDESPDANRGINAETSRSTAVTRNGRASTLITAHIENGVTRIMVEHTPFVDTRSLETSINEIDTISAVIGIALALDIPINSVRTALVDTIL